MVDQRDFRHDYYLDLVRGILARAWQSPRGNTQLVQSHVHFVILKDGTAIDPETRQGSGWAAYDRAALGAVLRAGKFPPLPEAYSGDRLGITVVFQRPGEETP
jgi:protein TonB